MSDQNTFVDPLEDLMNRHQGNVEAPQSTTVEEDDKYGNNDLANEIAAEDAAIERAKQERLEQLAAQQDETKATSAMPPRSLDPEFQAEKGKGVIMHNL